MHTDLTRSLTRPVTLVFAAAALACGGNVAHAAAPTSAPQVLLAITNSESMDGTTAGAIMVGSGSLASKYSSLSTSSSPTNYTVPAGFTPPVSPANSSGLAPYTAPCTASTTTQCDNGPSRMNFTKAAITSVLGTYGNTLNFGLYTYSTGSSGVYGTYVYYMSPPTTGFTFTNTASATTVANPCYNYTASSSAVKASCGNINGLYGTGVLAGNQYMNIGASSDDPQINDVLYTGSGGSAAFVTYGAVNPSSPYTGYTLNQYVNSNSSYSETYPSNTDGGGFSTTPTNAGYVPFSPQVMYSMRGFGYNANPSATTGAIQVAMGTDPTSSTFITALAPETNDSSTSEIKSMAIQSSIYGLMNGAKSYLNSRTTTTCQGQYVVMLTDGLPTLDKNGGVWPPLGTATANAYNVPAGTLTATFNADGSFASSTSQAVTDAIAAISALYNASGSTHIKVFVIGLGAGVDATVNPMAAKILQAMAIAGGTSNYQAANSAASLTAAFATIVNDIYNDSAIAAPVAPISVANGSGFEYNLTSIAVPAAGHAQAYAVSAAGAASTTATWDAATQMNATNRKTGTAALIAPSSAGTSMSTLTTLASAEPTLFVPTGMATTCVPDANTVVQFTIDPSYTGGCGSTGTGYLAGRQANWFLGAFSTQDSGHYVPPPSSTLLTQRYSSYATWATASAQTSRTPMLMFTDADGFLYAVDASATSTGSLLWGWTSRNIVGQLRNYSTFASSGSTDGGFTVVDAPSGSTWASYLVGSFQSGSEHFSVKLDSNGKPSSMVYDYTTTSGTSAGDKAGPAGATPLRQPTIVAYIGSSAYDVFIVTVGSTSTLYEVPVAATSSSTGNIPSGYGTALSFATSTVTATSAITFNPSTNQIFFGASDGSVYMATLTTGTPSTDVATMLKIGTTVNPTSSSTGLPVLYAGYVEIGGVPYVYAFNSAQLTVFGVTSTGYTVLWASTPSQGYTWASGTGYVASSTVTTFTTGSEVTDIPTVIGSALLVPVFVPGTGCSNGTGYYDFFDIRTGVFPTNLPVTINGVAITSDLNLGVGSGPAYSPSVTATSNGLVLNSGSKATTDDSNKRLGLNKNFSAKPYSWRQH